MGDRTSARASNRELGPLGEERADSPEIATRERIAPLDSGGKRAPVREVVAPGERVAVAGVRGQVVQIGWSEPGGKIGHDYMPIAWYPLSTYSVVAVMFFAASLSR